MFEICALLADRTPKARKVSDKPRAKPIKVGSRVVLHGREVVVVERDTKYPNAWYIEADGIRSQYSFPRDWMKVL